MILETAKTHFEDDIERAKNILEISLLQPESTLKADLKRSTWMFAVGSLDAFFCDVYGDLLASTFRAREIESSVILPERMKSVKIPAISFISRNPSDGWRWRLVARDVIELDNSTFNSKNSAVI